MIDLRKLLSLLVFFSFCASYADENPFSQFSSENQKTDDNSWKFDDEDEFDEEKKGIIAWCKRHRIITGAVVAAGITGAIACGSPTLFNQIMQGIKSNMSDFRNTLFEKKEEKLVNHNVVKNNDAQHNKKPEHVLQQNVMETTEQQSLFVFSPATKAQIKAIQNLVPDVCDFIKSNVLDVAVKQLHSKERIKLAGNIFRERQSEYQTNYLRYLDPNEQQHSEFKCFFRIDTLLAKLIAVCDLSENNEISDEDARKNIDIILRKIEKTVEMLSTYDTTKLTNKEFSFLIGSSAVIGIIITFLVVATTGHLK